MCAKIRECMVQLNGNLMTAHRFLDEHVRVNLQTGAGKGFKL